MKAKGKVISTLLIIDAFFVSFAVGFNSRNVLIVDPSLPHVMPAKTQEKGPIKSESHLTEPAKTAAAATKKGEHIQSSHVPAKHGSVAHGSKSSHKEHASVKTKPEHAAH